MSDFQEEEFIKLGKQLHEKELLVKRYQDNLKLLQDTFNKNVPINISKEQFQQDTIDTIIWNFEEFYEYDGQEFRILYARILEHKLADAEKEIETLKNAYTELEEINNSNLEDIEIFEKRILRGKEIVTNKNEIIHNQQKQIYELEKNIDLVYFLCLFLILNFLISIFNNDFYNELWFGIFWVFSSIVVWFFNLLMRLF